MKKLLFTILASLSCLSAEALPKPMFELRENNIELIYDVTVPLIIGIYALDCYCCQSLEPIFNELHKDFGEMFQFARLNARKETYFIDYFRLKRLPTIILMLDGKEVDRHIGAITKDELKFMLKRNFKY